MVSSEQKRAALEVFYSVNKSWFTQDLRHKLERLDHDSRIEISNQTSLSTNGDEEDHNDDDENSLPEVTVETLEKGFLINVLSERSCPGLLVTILEAVEELRIELLNARVSCSDCFQLQAVGEQNNEDSVGVLDAQVVKQALQQAIHNWNSTM